MTSVNTEHWTSLLNLNDPDDAPSNIQEIAVCEDDLPSGTQRLWMIKVGGNDRYVTQSIVEGGKNPTLDQLIRSANDLYTNKGYYYVCRAEEPDANGTYALNVYNPSAGEAAAQTGGVARCDEGMKGSYDVGPLTAQQAAYLESKLLSYANTPTIVCKKPTSDGEAIYWLNSQLGRWNKLIDGIESDIDDGNVPPYLYPDDAADLLQQLEDTRAGLPAYMQQQAADDRDSQGWVTKLLLAAIGISAYGAIRLLITDIKGWIRGRVKTTDYRKVVRNLLKTNKNYEVLGRMDEAREAWRQADTEGFRGIIVNAPTGEGKDEFAKAMIVIKEREAANMTGPGVSLVVPESFRNAPVYKINAAEFQAGTQYRGNVADKIAEIAGKARKGPVIYIISEIDLIFRAGGSSAGETEKVANLLLSLLEDEVIRDNLMLIGTTSRGDTMLMEHPDVERRFNWPSLHTYVLGEIENIIFNGPTRTTYEKKYGVSISQEAVDAATRLAIKYYRSPFTSLQVALGRNIPRFDAIKKVLEDAAKLAKRERTGNVTLEQVRRATEARYRVSISQEDMVSLLRVPDINSLDRNKYEASDRADWERSPFEQPQCVMETGDGTSPVAVAGIFTGLLKNDPELRLLTAGLSNADIAEYGRWLDAQWTAMSVGERATYMSAPGSYKMWVVEMSKAIHSGAMAEGMEAKRAKEKDKDKDKDGIKEKELKTDHAGAPGTSHGVK